MNPTIQIKLPFGLYKKANERNLLSLVKFYYKLKTLNIHGSFKQKNIYQFLRDNTGFSINTCKKFLKLLLEHKLAFTQNEYLCLISYDKLWAIFDIKPNKRNQFRLIRTTIDRFELDVYTQEIKLSLKKQKSEIKRKYFKDKLDSVKNAKIFISSYVEKLKEQVKFIQQKLKFKLSINREITLSCQKIANLFGYNSPMKGLYIQRLLERSRLIKIKKQYHLLVIKDICLSAFKSLNLDNSFYIKNNKVFKILPNIISII